MKDYVHQYYDALRPCISASFHGSWRALLFFTSFSNISTCLLLLPKTRRHRARS